MSKPTPTQSGELAGIARRSAPKAVMEPIRQAALTCSKGVMGDARGKSGKRQVTVLSAQSWSEVNCELGSRLDWLERRANLLVEGVTFCPDDVGRVLSVGTARLRITCECDPCSRMEAVHPGLRAALEPSWRGGVCCRVEVEGLIQIGDQVQWVDP